MTPEEYRKWRPTYDSYIVMYPPNGSSYAMEGSRLNKFLATTGLVSEASELMSVVHKAFRKNASIDLLKAKDEASDVWWYFNKILDNFGWTLEELSQHNKEKLDGRNR